MSKKFDEIVRCSKKEWIRNEKEEILQEPVDG